MKKLIGRLLPLMLLLTACGGDAGNAPADRVPEAQTLYAALQGYAAEVTLELPREDETLRYTLSLTKDGDALSARVLAPDALRGVTAHIDGETLALEYDGAVLDAGTVNPKVSALSCVPLLLRAFPESYVTARSTERFGEQDALRVCFETDCGGEKLACVMYFSEENAPLYAEIAENGKIILFAQFTSFTFGDILPSDAQTKSG